MQFALPGDIRIGNAVTQDLFGTNMMFHRNRVGEDGTFDEVADALGAGGVRYPGGAISEVLFDITNPNATTAVDPADGKIVPIEPLSDVIAWAADTGRAMTVVLPTRTYLTTETDENGHRYADVDEAALRDFTSKLVGGEFGKVDIAGLEIGNEYWGIGFFDQGSMTTLEYGRVASRMVEILSDTLAAVPGGEDVAILVQMGTNFNAARLDDLYEGIPRGDMLIEEVTEDMGFELPDSVVRSSGDLDWPALNNVILIEEMTKAGVIDDIDGIIAHVYSRYPVLPSSRHWHLDTIEKTWGEAHPGIETWVTEWSRKAATKAFEKTEDYGLKTANELVDVMGFLADYEVENAYIWTAQHNTKTTLARLTGPDDANPVELTAAGEAFRMMQDALPGLSVLDLAPLDRGTNAIDEAGIDLHAFANGDRFVMYLANSSTETQDFTLDLKTVLEGYDSVSITRLGVAPGQNPADPRSKAVVTENPDEATMDGTEIKGLLQGLELLEIVVERPDYVDAFGDALEAAEAPPTNVPPPKLPIPRMLGTDEPPEPDDMSDLLTPPASVLGDDDAPPPETDPASAEDDGGDGGGFGGAFLGLLPLLLLAALGGGM